MDSMNFSGQPPQQAPGQPAPPSRYPPYSPVYQQQQQQTIPIDQLPTAVVPVFSRPTRRITSVAPARPAAPGIVGDLSRKVGSIWRSVARSPRSFAGCCSWMSCCCW